MCPLAAANVGPGRSKHRRATVARAHRTRALATIGPFECRVVRAPNLAYTAPTMQKTALFLLGAAAVGPPGAVAALPADRRGCLLAYVAYDGAWVDRNRLALLLWPESDEASAKGSLRQLLLRVKRLDLAGGLEVTPTSVRWSVACDVTEFRRALAVGDVDGALRLYRGPLLDGFVVHDVGGVDAWLETERQHLHAAFHGASMREAATSLAQGRYVDAAERLGRLLELDPMAEDVLQGYLQALSYAGRRDAGVVAFDRFAQRLWTELGLEPLAPTRALVEALRRGDAAADRPPSDAARRFPARSLQPSRLVARERELAAARAATTPLIVVVGEPGVGKTRFVRDLQPDALWCSAHEGLEGLPYHPFATAVRTNPAHADGLGPYREDLARLVPEVAPDLTPGPLEPGTAKARLAEALARVVDASGGSVVVDDLQWADPASLELIVYLVARGLRIVGTYRVGEDGPALRATLQALRSRGVLSDVALDPLDEHGIRALIGDLMGIDDGPPVFAKRLWQRSSGNPMFVLETLRALLDTGVLRSDQQGWHTDVDMLTRDYAELDVPTKVFDVIGRRVARLEPSTVRVLEAAALAQAGMDVRLLARVTGLSVPAVADALSEASNAGFLEGGAFRHDLLRQCLDRGIDELRRRILHGLLADELEGRAEPGVVAEHSWRAGDHARARGAWLEQAARLRSRGLHDDAIAALDVAAARLPPGEDRDWVRLAAVNAMRESGDADEAERWLVGLGDTTSYAAAFRFAHELARVSLALHRGRVDEAEAIVAAARSLAVLVDDPDLELEGVMMRVRVLKELVRPQEAADVLEVVVERLRGAPPSLMLVQFLTSLASLYDDLGRPAGALPLHLEALDLARALGARYHQVEVCVNLLFCYAELGRHDDAVDLAEEALALGSYDNTPILRNNLAANHFEAGRFAEALAHYRPLVDRHDQPYIRTIALARCAEIHARAGDVVRARSYLDGALDAVPTTDYAVSLGRVAIAVLRFGSDAQVARLGSQVSDLWSRIPPNQRSEFDVALAARSSDART